MKIYVDLVFFMNLVFDFLLLLTLKITMKKQVKLYRIILASLVGGTSIFFLFLPLNSITLFILKVIISLLMIGISFGVKDIKVFIKDVLYLYFISIILGGFLYYLNLEFSYKNQGLIFFHNGFSINFILLFILSPIILYLHIKQVKEMKVKQNTYYGVSFYYHRKKYNYSGYLDTGNKLYDPYKKRMVLLLYDPNFKVLDSDKKIYVPYCTLDNKGVIVSISIKKIFIDGEEINKEVLIGISKEPFHIEGIDMIIHPDIFV